MREDTTLQLPETLIVKTPHGFKDALKTAAQRQLTSRSDYVRQALIRQLTEDGICPIYKPAAA